MVFQIISPAIDIAVIAAMLSLASMAVQLKFLDWRKTRMLQKSIQEKNKRALELAKKGDEASKKEAEELQKQIMQDMQAQFKSMPKQLIVSSAIFLPPFLLIKELYSKSGIIVRIPFDIPFFGAEWGWLKWYFVCALVAGIVINFIVTKIEERKVQ